MSTVLPSAFAEFRHRLALGLELIDALRGQRIGHPIRVEVEGTPAYRARHSVDRHDSCLHALLYRPGMGTHANIRILDPDRQFVPRRFRVPLPDLDGGAPPPASHRARRPFLFPGAAYPTPETATGLRGRVVNGGQPLRWARIVAEIPDSGQVVGRAHGDDRGEFLLILDSSAMQVGELISPLPIRVRVFAPSSPPAPDADDPLSDLPLEVLPAAGLPDDVASGETVPPSYDASATRVVDFVPGRILSSEIDEFTIP